MDAILTEILASTQLAQNSVSTLQSKLEELDTTNGMTLLALKNEELLSYVHNGVMVLGGQLGLRGLLSAGSTKKSGKEDEGETKDEDEKVRLEAIKNTISARVALEKGIKPLESRVSYEIDKALRNYEKERAKQKEEKEGSGSEDSDDDDESEEEEEEEEGDGDLLAFKPNPMALMASSKTSKKKSKNDDDSSDDSSDEDSDSGNKPKHYVAPKISSVLPSSSLSSAQLDEDTKSSSRSNSRMRRNALLEEYLADTSSAPQLESSIGSTILDMGRGGTRSELDKRKEREIRDYEESNYTRLTDKMKERHMGKQNKGGRGRRGAPNDEFFGEKWDFGTSAKTGKGKGNDIAESTRKRKGNGGSVWEKASKRRR